MGSVTDYRAAGERPVSLAQRTRRSPMRRHLIAATILVCAAGLAWLGYVRSGRPRVLSRPEGEVVVPPAGRPGAVVWVEDAPSGPRLMLSRRWGSPRALLSASITGAVVEGGKALVAQQDGAQGRIASVDLSTGNLKALVSVKGRAQQLAAAGGTVAWLEERDASIPAAPFVVAAGPVTVIRSMEQEPGPVSLVAVLTPDPAPLVTRAPRSGAAQMLGISGSRVYWLERQGREVQTTVLRSCPVTGGQPQTIASEFGSQQAVLLSDAVLWTSYSQEAQSNEGARSVKRLPLGGGEPQVIADWLGRDTVLLGSGTRAYAQEKGVLWSLGDRRGEQRVLYTRPGLVGAAHAVGDDEYLVLLEGKKLAIAERPLSWWARIRHVLRG